MSFFSFFSIFGLSYKGTNNTNSYIAVLIISSILTYFILILDLCFFKKIDKKGLLLLGVIFFVSFSYLLSGNFTLFNNQIMSIFIIIVIPSVFIGHVLAKKKELSGLKDGLVLISVLIFIGMLRSLGSLLSEDLYSYNDEILGGNFQAVSYFAAFSFSVLLADYLFYRIKKSFLIKLFYLIAFFFLILTVILSGGRGGALVVIISTLIFFTWKYSYYIIFKNGLLVGLSLMVISFIMGNYLINDRILQGGERIFSYITNDGIDVSNSSDRDIVWERSLKMIKKNLFTGYGLFSTSNILGSEFSYSHNIFLDFILHGGIFYLLVWIVILVVIFKKVVSMVARDISQIIILVPLLNSFILLLFSGTYLTEHFFWFSISYVYSYKLKEYVPSS